MGHDASPHMHCTHCSKGDIVIDLMAADCPVTTKNFIKLCKWVACTAWAMRFAWRQYPGAACVRMSVSAWWRLLRIQG
jgi:cyclophilin family peptidyl-prolyl cis-trans isomerase